MRTPRTLALAAGLLTACLATAAAGLPAIPSNGPVLVYYMSGLHGNQYSHGQVAAVTNTAGYNYRAHLFCVNGPSEYGPWTTKTQSQGGSSTASCPGNDGYNLEGQFDKTHGYQVACWSIGMDSTGQCVLP